MTEKYTPGSRWERCSGAEPATLTVEDVHYDRQVPRHPESDRIVAYHPDGQVVGYARDYLDGCWKKLPPWKVGDKLESKFVDNGEATVVHIFPDGEALVVWDDESFGRHERNKFR